MFNVQNSSRFDRFNWSFLIFFHSWQRQSDNNKRQFILKRSRSSHAEELSFIDKHDSKDAELCNRSKNWTEWNNRHCDKDIEKKKCCCHWTRRHHHWTRWDYSKVKWCESDYSLFAKWSIEAAAIKSVVDWSIHSISENSFICCFFCLHRSRCFENCQVNQII